MHTIVVPGTAHPGASRRHRIPHLEQHEQNSTRGQRANILLSRFQYVFFNGLIYKDLLL